MKRALLVALLLTLASPALAADSTPPVDPLFQPEPVWLQASASCEGTIGGGAAEIFVSCPGQTAAQCCRTVRNSYPSFVGVCQGDAEIQCG